MHSLLSPTSGPWPSSFGSPPASHLLPDTTVLPLAEMCLLTSDVGMRFYEKCWKGGICEGRKGWEFADGSQNMGYVLHLGKASNTRVALKNSSKAWGWKWVNQGQLDNFSSGLGKGYDTATIAGQERVSSWRPDGFLLSRSHEPYRNLRLSPLQHPPFSFASSSKRSKRLLWDAIS